MNPTQCDICQTQPEDIIKPAEIRGRLLYCTCPLCDVKVAAEIYEGQITCPACGAIAPWSE